MLAFTRKYPEWRDFPRGLRVLVVDEDEQLLADLKSKLEAFDYVVTTFASSGDAVIALRSQSSEFHVALVEATSGEDKDGSKVLEAATHLPVIMMSSTENMAVMMKGLAFGASEFLQKPLSDETLKNIWQHVVRKALCNGELPLPESLQPEESSEPPSSLVRSEAADPIKMETPETSCRTESSKNDQSTTNSLVEVKVEPSTDEVEPADLFIHEEEHSTLFDIKPGLAENCSFLSSERFTSTAISWDASAEPSGSHGFDSVKNGLNASSHEFSVYDGYLQAKSDLEDMSDESSADLCGLLGADMEDDLVEVDDLETMRSDHCSDLQFDEELQLDDSLGDTTLSSQFVIDGDTLSSIEMDPNSLDGLAFSRSLALGAADSLDEAMGHDTDFADEEALLLEEVKRADENVARNSSESSRHQRLIGSPETSSTDNKAAKQGDPEESGDGSKIPHGKRKRKVDWTPELHRRFVQAVEQLGVDKAIPSRILEIMGVQCLTRHNIASHLQKYRSHRKHLLVREAEAASWNQRRHLETGPWGRPRRDGPSWLSHSHHATTPIQPRPAAMSQAPMQPHPSPQGHTIAPLHVWGHPTVDHSHMHMWQKPPVAATAWRTSNGTLWQQPACIDAWGHPAPAPGMPFYPQAIMRLPLAPMPGVANMAYPVFMESTMENLDATSLIFGNGKIPTFHLSKETVDAAINEVLTNPCTPLPLGLKPPSLESVINELQRQGIRTTPTVSS